MTCPLNFQAQRALAMGCVVLVAGLCGLVSGDEKRDEGKSGEMETRRYQVPQASFVLPDSDDGRGDSFAAPAGVGAESLSKLRSPQVVLERAGITFGEGSYAKGYSRTGNSMVLAVHNTSDQLELVEAYLHGGCIAEEKQLTVIVEYIEVDAAWLSGWILDHRLYRDGTPLREDVQKLVRAEKARVADTLAVAARSGQRAKTESISEYIFPRSGDPPNISNSVNLAGKAEAPITSFAIGSWVQSHVGISLEVDPMIGADNTTIWLNAAPWRRVLDGETRWPLDDSESEFLRVMPKAYTENNLGQVTVTDGHYELLGTVTPKEPGLEGAKKTKVLVFIRADIGVVGGEPNRRE